MLYVHGLLNRLLWPDLDQNGNWKHAICINTDTGRFFDQQQTSRSVKTWLQCAENDMYMSEIWRVYKLEVV